MAESDSRGGARATSRKARRRARALALAAILAPSLPIRLVAAAEDPCGAEYLVLDFEVRRQLCGVGIKLRVIETSEILGNPTGGLRQGAIYEGLTDLSLGIHLRPTLPPRRNLFPPPYPTPRPALSTANYHNLH